MKKGIIIAGIILLILWIVGVYSESEDIALEKLDNCQNLAIEIDEVYKNLDTDYMGFVSLMNDWMNNDISDFRANADVDVLMENIDKRDYRYQRAIDLYNDNCFLYKEKNE